MLHLAINARALHGAAAFADAVATLERLPGLAALEVVFVYMPLLFHGAIGGWLVATRRSLPRPAPYSPATRVAMRATGVLVAAFLLVHLAQLGFYPPRFHAEGHELATRLDAALSSVSFGVPWSGAAYLLGTGCAVFHLAAGLWGAFAATGRGRSSIQRRRWAAWTLAGLGAAMWLLYADVIVFRATGGALFGDAQDEPPGGPCP